MGQVHKRSWYMPSHPRRWMWGGAAALLAMPAVAMRFSTQVRWGPGDFVVFGAMLLVACITCEAGVRLLPASRQRVGVAVAVATGFVQLWMNLAVGLVGAPDAPANLAFHAVLLLGALLAAIGRGSPIGLVRALRGTALAQLLVGGFAGWMGSPPGAVLGVTFAVAWWLAASLCVPRPALPSGSVRVR